MELARRGPRRLRVLRERDAGRGAQGPAAEERGEAEEEGQGELVRLFLAVSVSESYRITGMLGSSRGSGKKLYGVTLPLDLPLRSIGG